MFFKIVLHFSYILFAFSIIINENVDRNINLTTQIVKIKEIVTFRNGYKGNITTYSYVIEDPLNAHVEFYQNDKILDNDIVTYKNETYKEYVVKLSKPIRSYDKCTITVKILKPNQLKLLNKMRKPDESQLCQYVGNVFFYSKYTTKNYKCIIDVKNRVLEMSQKFYQDDDDRIIYKVIELRPFSKRKLKLIFENYRPYYLVNDLERTIYVSHYGKILVREKINISNIGSLLNGPYDSINTKRTWFDTYLPSSAEDVQLYDVLGVNGKTKLSTHNDFKTLHFQLRYPLLGGWKSLYNLQYTLPSYEYLWHDREGRFLLRMRIIDHILNDIVIENAKINILLPEGTKIESVNFAEEFYESDRELAFTSLSFNGKPNVIFYGKNLTESHILPFDVVYKISPLEYYRIPLILTAYVQIVFVAAIIYNNFKN